MTSSWIRMGAKCVFVGITEGLKPMQPGTENIRDVQKGVVYTINFVETYGPQVLIGFSEAERSEEQDVAMVKSLLKPTEVFDRLIEAMELADLP